MINSPFLIDRDLLQTISRSAIQKVVAIKSADICDLTMALANLVTEDSSHSVVESGILGTISRWDIIPKDLAPFVLRLHSFCAKQDS